MLQKTIYLDNAATTPIDPEVLKVMTDHMKNSYGNPSSIHQEGRKSRSVVEKARKTIAKMLNVSIGEIYFTAGGTEANNMVLVGSVRDLNVKRIISSPTEHPAILEMLSYLETHYDVDIQLLEVDEMALPNYVELDNILRSSDQKTLVTLMHSNNELGTLMDLDKVARICQDNNALFHSDTVQTMGYYPMDFDATKISFASASAHKLYGPKGVGFLYMSNDNIVQPLIYGGGQERGMRSGTENIYGIVGLAKAMELMNTNHNEIVDKVTQLRTHAITSIKNSIPEIEIIHEDVQNSHYKVIHLILPDIPKAELIVMNLDIEGICVSGGSACSSGAEKSSHVIDAISPNDGRKHLRVSLSHHNTIEELNIFVSKLKKHLE